VALVGSRLRTGVELTSDTTILSVSGEVDLNTETVFDRLLRSHLADGATQVVLDLTDIDFLSIAGHRILQVAVHEAAARGVRVRVHAGPTVRHVDRRAAAIGRPSLSDPALLPAARPLR
jgi:anti-anti-sigma factor